MSNFDMSGLQKKLQAARGLKPSVIRRAYDYFKNITPIRSGNARNNTKMNNNRIEAKYQYASVLDAGRKRVGNRMQGSNQAPEGMSKPTIKRFKAWCSEYLKMKVGS